jgi:hypothetical protein
VPRSQLESEKTIIWGFDVGAVLAGYCDSFRFREFAQLPKGIEWLTVLLLFCRALTLEPVSDRSCCLQRSLRVAKWLAGTAVTILFACRYRYSSPVQLLPRRRRALGPWSLLVNGNVFCGGVEAAAMLHCLCFVTSAFSCLNLVPVCCLCFVPVRVLTSSSCLFCVDVLVLWSSFEPCTSCCWSENRDRHG